MSSSVSSKSSSHQSQKHSSSRSSRSSKHHRKNSSSFSQTSSNDSLGVLPHNEAAIEFARLLEKRNSSQIALQKSVDREARQRYESAIKEARLKWVEKKIVGELSKIQDLEHQQQLDRVKTIRGKDAISKTYMVEARYDDKQRSLNQMLIDDRMHPRTSQPEPLKMPNLRYNTPNLSDEENL